MTIEKQFKHLLNNEKLENEAVLTADEHACTFMDWATLNYYYNGASTLNRWKASNGDLLTIHQLMLIYKEQFPSI